LFEFEIVVLEKSVDRLKWTLTNNCTGLTYKEL